MENQPGRATRLTIEYDGDDLKVVATQSVKMMVPASDDRYGLEGRSGFWIELQAEDQECLYRKVMPEPMADQMEAPSGDPEKPFTRTPPQRAKGVFTLLVPELSEARQLYLCSSPRKDPTARARPIAMIDLRKPMGKVRRLSDTRPSEPKPSGTRPSRRRSSGARPSGKGRN
jgi:hypothetical protein